MVVKSSMSIFLACTRVSSGGGGGNGGGGGSRCGVFSSPALVTIVPRNVVQNIVVTLKI